MEFKLIKLVLQFRLQLREITFGHITYIHGETSTGKSSIAGLIDYCLGGDFNFPPVIDEELVYAELHCQITKYLVTLRRHKHTNRIHVSWSDEETYNNVLAPIDPIPNGIPIFSDDVYNISDLLFYLLGPGPIKVPKSKMNVDSPLVRLSFRDIMWYCYLKQINMLSQFFMLKNPERMYKSRDVMRFIVGLYNERLNELEIDLNKLRELRLQKQVNAAKMAESINLLGYKSESDLEKEIESINNELSKLRNEKSIIKNQYNQKTHFTDDLRNLLRNLSKKLALEEEALIDLEKKINQTESLKSEFISSKIKLERIKSASIVLSKVQFKLCPLCGNNIASISPDDLCPLCKEQIVKMLVHNRKSKL